jgi:hypothetical protein
MMGRQRRDHGKLFYEFRLEDRIPENHLLRRIRRYGRQACLNAFLARQVPPGESYARVLRRRTVGFALCLDLGEVSEAGSLGRCPNAFRMVLQGQALTPRKIPSAGADVITSVNMRKIPHHDPFLEFVLPLRGGLGCTDAAAYRQDLPTCMPRQTVVPTRWRRCDRSSGLR